MQHANHDIDAPGIDPKTDPRNRIAAGAFFAVWAVVGWISMLTNVQIVGVDFGLDPGPGLMPTIVLSIVSAGSLSLIMVGLAGLTKGPFSPIPWRSVARQMIMPLLLVGSLLGYVPLIRWIGFSAANALFASGWMVILSAADLRREPLRALLPIFLGTVIGVGLIYFVFIYWIGVPLR